MAKISVLKPVGIVFKVTVKDSDGSTARYEVRLDEGYFRALMGGRKVAKEALIEKSFEFLLERESKDMIFKEFNLLEIENYFPEYREEIKRRLESDLRRHPASDPPG